MLSSYPHLTVTVDVKGILIIWCCIFDWLFLSVLDDEEENRITVGSVVTVDVEITRNQLMVRGSHDPLADHVIH